jgi:CheY-like chemotaxis protein
MARVLIVEDQRKHLESLQRSLEAECYEVVAASTGDEGFQAAMTQAVDAVILDLMLPGRHGLKVLRDLRANGFAKPVLILTALDAVEERVQGLDSHLFPEKNSDGKLHWNSRSDHRFIGSLGRLKWRGKPVGWGSGQLQ